MKLISRESWGARYGRGPTNITPQNGGVAVHYVGSGRLTNVSHSKCAGRVRSIENDHVNGNGWAGIAYNFLACHHGYVFEGRGLGHRSAAQGTNSGNQNYYAVCALIGASDTASDTLKIAIRDAIDYCKRHGAGSRIRGHRDFRATSCPGDPLYAWVRKGAPRPEEEEETLKTLVDLGAVSPQSVPAGQRGSLAFEIEYLDPEKVHSDPEGETRHPSVSPTGGDAPYAVTVEVVLGSPAPAGVQLVVASYFRDRDEHERDIRGIDLVGSRSVLTSVIRMNNTRKYRADIVNNSGSPVSVQRAYMLIAH
jgi:hypothetical protein